MSLSVLRIEQCFAGRQDFSSTTIQAYLDELNAAAGGAPSEGLIRELLGRAVNRLHWLCELMLQRQYPRLSQGPLNLTPEELLGGVVERLIKAMRQVHPVLGGNFNAGTGANIGAGSSATIIPVVNSVSPTSPGGPITLNSGSTLFVNPTMGTLSTAGYTPGGQRRRVRRIGESDFGDSRHRLPLPARDRRRRLPTSLQRRRHRRNRQQSDVHAMDRPWACSLRRWYRVAPSEMRRTRTTWWSPTPQPLRSRPVWCCSAWARAV